MVLLPTSQLKSAKQLELLGDVDLESFRIQMRDKAGIQLVEAIVDAQCNRTIEGASTLVVTVDDDLERTIQTSGKLGRRVDVNVDGLWWTLKAISKQQRQLALTFEEREANFLRYYDKFRQWRRDEYTRAEVAKFMIEEVKEAKLRWVIPELHKKGIISDLAPGEIQIDPQTGQTIPQETKDLRDRTGGIPLANKLLVKTTYANAEQIGNANAILGVGTGMGVRRKLLVCSIMTAIQENSINGSPGEDYQGHKINVGVFQQDDRYWPATNNVVTDAGAFFRSAVLVDQRQPNLTYNDLCQAVQGSGFPNAYGQWFDHANAFVDAYGAIEDFRKHNNQRPAVVADNDPYVYYRGDISQNNAGVTVLKPETSWACMNRLAKEVNWYCFCVSGLIYFVSGEYLFKSKPFMVIDEDSPGIDWIDYDYDEGKRVATINITAHIKRWASPPGSVVQIQNMGVINGRWLVNDVQRSLFETTGQIMLKKPDPILPEPTATSQAKQFQFGATPPGTNPQPQTTTDNTGLTPNTVQQIVVSYASAQLGKPYQWGAEGPGTFDCSGLTQAAYAEAHIALPHHAQSQLDQGPRVSVVQTLQPADLVFFNTEPSNSEQADHCGVYIGNNQFIHAPHTGDVVKTSDIASTYYNEAFVGATRPWTTAPTTANQANVTNSPVNTPTSNFRKAFWHVDKAYWRDTKKPAELYALTAWLDMNPGRDIPNEGEIWQVDLSKYT